ncbi:MAG: hypothetical protein MUC69_06390 [Gemmatimonadales bacterium]|jgi:YHS domain-containing protein|nr:hypothetical protein [Gemmatimonadales bacterium]
MRSLLHRAARALPVAALLVSLPLAASAQMGKTALNIDDNQLALHGYDAVAYQTESRAVRGSGDYTAVHEGAIYRFASATNRDAFKAGPSKYVPQFGGYCAMGVAVGKKLDVDPNAFKVMNGKTYLNVNAEVQKAWLKSPDKHIATASTKWPAVAAHAGFDSM